MAMKRYTASVVLMALAATGAFADQAEILNASFEVGEAVSWKVLYDSYPVTTTDRVMEGSNFDGVAGSRFMLFGTGRSRGSLQFQIPTVPGKEYVLSYFCGATDTQRFGDSGGVQISFRSMIFAFHGVKTKLGHDGEPIEYDQLEEIYFRTHEFNTPGLVNWRIYSWLPVSYTFIATSEETRVIFSTATTNGVASVGVLDQVRVTTEPFAQVSAEDIGLKLSYAGKLEESEDLISWSEVTPQPGNPYRFTPIGERRFFRVQK